MKRQHTVKPVLLFCLVVATAANVFLGCDPGIVPSDDRAGMRSSTLSLGGADGPDLSSRSLASGDRVYFRSSDIEFWQISSVADIGSLVSAKYVRWGQAGSATEVDYAESHSLEYRLGDAAESVVFSPDQNMRVGFDRGDLNPDWAAQVGDYVAAGNSQINAMRLDIGGGQVTFVIDGQERTVFWANGSYQNGINGNSIFFVDRAFLKKPILITRDVESEVIAGTTSAAALGLSTDEFALVQAIHTSHNNNDNTTPIDVNGALIVPMDPVTLAGFDPATETLDIVFWWKIEEAVHYRNGQYFMDRRVGETCFDFDVEIKRSPK